ncbi:MAG: alpha/beta hydrolase [Chitinophagales bacterium]
MDSNAASTQKYIFYLHGMIVENMGAKAVSPYFGAYQYDDILDTFRKAGFTVMSEVRKPNTDVKTYANTIAAQINDLLKKGVESKNITVIGASKGALIAMHVSTVLKNKDLNFVFLAACNDGNFQSYPEIHFYGNILSIFEKSDDIGESCISFRNKSGDSIQRYKELEINTGLQHGFLFRPIPEWTKPAIDWANGIY